MSRPFHPVSRRVPAPVVGALVCALVGAPLLASGSAQAAEATATDAKAASANSAWLAAKLEDGAFPNPMNPTLPDYGLMIDAVLAMYGSGNGDLAAPIIERLGTKQEGRRYFTYYGFGEGQDWLQNEGLDDRVGGAVAKVLVAAQVAGKNPRAFGGYDLVKETQDVIVRPEDVRDGGRFAAGSTTNPLFTIGASEVGRVVDYGPTTSYNNANTFGQGFAVTGLAAADANDQAAIDKLVWQQCSAGYFRVFYSHNADTGQLESCDEGKRSPVFGKPGEYQDNSPPDRDATAFAVSSLRAAQRAGASGLKPSIDRAVSWLKSEQQGHGGWGGGVSTEAPNTNSTGLVVQALHDADGDSDAVRKGTAYLRSAQVVDGDKDSALGQEVGAIGYTPADYEAARTSGIGGLDTWIRASSQASLGISRATMWDLATGRVPQGDQTEVPPPSKPKPPTGSEPNRPTHPNAAPGLTKPPTRKPGATGATGATGSSKPATAPARPGASAPKAPARPAAPVPAAASLVEAGTPSATGRLGRYLAGQLVDGTHVVVTEGPKSYVDYDATADTIFALRALGEQPKAIARASAFLLTDASVKAYVHGLPYDDAGALYAVPAAKTILVGQAVNAEGTPNPATTKLVQRLATDLKGLQQEDGRFADRGSYADDPADLQRHVWATLALTATETGPAVERATTLLRERQCADGSFDDNLANLECATGQPRSTATALVGLAAIESGRARTLDTAALSGDLAESAQRAAAALAKEAPTGRIDASDGQADLAATSFVVAGRQAAGLDSSSLARSLSGLLRPDGAVQSDRARTPDPVASREAAMAVAGRSWIGTASSPIVFAPFGEAVVTADDEQVTGLAGTSAPAEPWWRQPVGIAGIAFLALLGGAALTGVVLRRRPLPATA